MNVNRHVWITRLFGAAMLLLCLASAWWIDRKEIESYRQDQRAWVQTRLAGMRADLEKSLNQRLHLVRGLAAFARSRPEFDAAGFQVFARELQGGQAGIRSLQLAPAGVVRHLYPLAGNEAALGHDLMRDPLSGEVVRDMVRTGEFRLAGPLPLRQGGVGLIGRMPIFLDAEAGQTRGAFWGFATILLDYPSLMREAGLAGADLGIEWAMRGQDGLGERGGVFLGDAALFATEAMRVQVSLPSGSWQLAGRPAGGWSRHWPGRSWLVGASLLVAAIILLAMALQIRYQESLNGARRAAEAANRAKSDFLANISHEVRTPINAVIGFTQLALRADPEPKMKGYLQKVQGSTYILLNLINDILDLSKIEANRLVLERVPFGLGDVFDNLANVIALQASQKSLELAFHIDQGIPAHLIGDPLRLGQALTNLAVNAVKFTESGEVVVTAERVAAAPGGGPVRVRFTVRDSGIGIAADQLDGLFSPFTQADSSITRRYGGTGLGLSITKQLVERMGGRVTVASRPGLGSTFSFSLGFECEDLGQAAFCPLVNGHGLRLLVVDDNASARDILVETLAGVALRVQAAESGEAALALLGESTVAPWDVILLDWRMPGLDGLETGRRIAAHYGAEPSPTLLMVTAYDDEDIRQAAAEAGIRRFLTKPVNPLALLDAILGVVGFDAPAAPEPDLADRMRPWFERIRGHRVLVADDNRVNREVVAELLALAGAEVVPAEHGGEALDILRRGGIDAVLMDVQMPHLDGLQTTAILRRDAAYRHLPIVAMTAHAQVEDRERCLAVGMNDHIAKPIDPDLLFRTLARWLSPRDPDGAAVVAPGGVGLPANLPGIDLAAGLKVVAGNGASLLRMLRRFSADFATAPERLEAHAAAGDMEALGRLAHAIRGGAGNIGALGVAGLAGELERAEAECVPDLAARLGTALAVVVATGQSLVTEAAGTMPARDGAAATELIERIEQRLKARKLIAPDDLAGLRGNFTEGAGLAVELFAQALDRFDYREAERQLAALRQTLPTEP